MKELKSIMLLLMVPLFLIIIVILNTFEKEDNNGNSYSASFVRFIDSTSAIFLIDDTEYVVKYNLIYVPKIINQQENIYEPEAEMMVEKLLSKSKEIIIKTNDYNAIDKYERPLAYVFIDGKLLQKILIEEGFAEVQPFYRPNEPYLKELQLVEKKAKQKKRGIWSLYSTEEKMRTID